MKDENISRRELLSAFTGAGAASVLIPKKALTDRIRADGDRDCIGVGETCDLTSSRTKFEDISKKFKKYPYGVPGITVRYNGMNGEGNRFILTPIDEKRGDLSSIHYPTSSKDFNLDASLYDAEGKEFPVRFNISVLSEITPDVIWLGINYINPLRRYKIYTSP